MRTRGHEELGYCDNMWATADFTREMWDRVNGEVGCTEDGSRVMAERMDVIKAGFEGVGGSVMLHNVEQSVIDCQSYKEFRVWSNPDPTEAPGFRGEQDTAMNVLPASGRVRGSQEPGFGGRLLFWFDNIEDSDTLSKVIEGGGGGRRGKECVGEAGGGALLAMPMVD